MLLANRSDHGTPSTILTIGSSSLGSPFGAEMAVLTGIKTSLLAKLLFNVFRIGQRAPRSTLPSAQTHGE
jgi:hypothetical protein